jgi:hypothetical protein
MAAKKSTATKRKPAATGTLLVPEKLTPLVHYLRHEKVILDSDLAELYGIETGRLNEAVKRNLDRFPEDFMFQLTEDELEALLSQFAIAKDAQSHLRSHTVTLDPASEPLRSQIATSRNADSALRHQSGKATSKGGRRTRPYAFTEQGVAMLSSVLRSDRAIRVNVEIMRAFVRMRQMVGMVSDLALRLEDLEEQYDEQFRVVFQAIRDLMKPTPQEPRPAIGFRKDGDHG